MGKLKIVKDFLPPPYLLTLKKENSGMTDAIAEQYIVNEKGMPTAVILPIEHYKKILSMLKKTANHSETDILAESPQFAELVRKSMEDIRLNKVAPWKEVWDEL